MATIANLMVVLGANTSQFNSAMKSAQATVSTFSSAAKASGTASNAAASGLMGMAAAAGPVGIALAAAISILENLIGVVEKEYSAFVKFGAECVQLGSDMNEVQNVVDVTFGRTSKTINDFSKTAMTQFGISELAAKKFSGTLGAMFKSMGVGQADVVDMSMNLTALAGDLTSFYNIPLEESFEKIRAGIAGEVEPLRQLGINMTVANLQAYALSQGIKMSYDKMDQATKAMLTYNYLMSVTTDQQGDFARTSGSWANQVRILNLQIDQAKTIIGQGLIPVLLPLLQLLNRVMGYVVQFAQAWAFAVRVMVYEIQALWGLVQSLLGVGNASTKHAQAVEEYENTLLATAKAGNKATKSNNDLGASIKGAAGAAKKAIAPFDQLNILMNGRVGGGGGTFAPPTVGDTSGVISDIDNKFNEIKRTIDSWLNTIQTNWNDFWSGKWIADDVKKAWDSLKKNFPFLEKFDVVFTAVASIVTTWSEFVKTVRDAWTNLKQGDINFFEFAGIVISAGFKAFVQTWADIFKMILGGWAALLGIPTGSSGSGGGGSPPFTLTASAGAIVDIISCVIRTPWEMIKAWALGAWAGIKKVIDFTAGVKVNWDVLQTGFSTTWDNIVAKARTAVNQIIDDVNRMIRSINSTVKVTMPWWLGGGTFSINIPQIPRLAQGGMFDRATPAIIGEHGKEAAIPLENNLAALDYIVSKFVSRMPAMATAGGGGDNYFYVDSDQVAVHAVKRSSWKNRLGGV